MSIPKSSLYGFPLKHPFDSCGRDTDLDENDENEAVPRE